jgi:hypothetical protein
MRRLFFVIVMTLLAACPGAPASGTDAGLPDAGLPDAGPPDAGLPDAGPPDAGLPDAGLPDAGLGDAGVDAGGCTDPFEPNDTAPRATNAPGGLSGGLSICSADIDWFQVTVAPGRVVSVGMLAALPAGDLDLATFDSSNQCVGGRSPGTCVSPTRFDETGEEFQTVVNVRDAGSKTWLFQVNGYQAATNGYVLSVDELAWSDGRDCGAPYTPADCTGQVDAGGRMLQVPYAALDDAYVGDGYRLDSPANYRFARRELVMLLRYAIHQTQAGPRFERVMNHYRWRMVHYPAGRATSTLSHARLPTLAEPGSRQVMGSPRSIFPSWFASSCSQFSTNWEPPDNPAVTRRAAAANGLSSCAQVITRL